MKERNKDKQKDLDDLGAKEDPLPQIPAGDYEAVCVKTERSDYLGKEKRLYIHFQIIDGEYIGTKLYAVYNIKYKVFSTATKYYTDWSIANGALPKRRDRMTAKVFKDKPFLVKVRDTAPKYEDGTLKPKMFRRSIIDRIIERLI